MTAPRSAASNVPPPAAAAAPTRVESSGAVAAVAVGRHPGLVWLVAALAALAGALAPAPWWQLVIIALAVAVCATAGRLRARALHWGLWGALLFVTLRIVYRIVFSSTVAPPAEAVLLIDLPLIPLAGPFRGIALLGPVTLDQLVATLAEASRFAVVVVVFGAANALADARTLLARAPRPMLSVATVLALALGTVPALLTATGRVAQAARLRGERRGPRLLVPVFEQAVERAGTLGASMELRGYGATGTALRGAGGSPQPHGRSAGTEAEAGAEAGPEVLVRAEGLALHYGGPGRTPAVAGAHLELRAGELTVVSGPTGGGKSSLLALLTGLAPAYTGGVASGMIRIAGEAIPAETLRPARLAGIVASVPQRVEHSFVAETVRAELAFAPTRQGLSGMELADEVESTLTRFHLGELAARDPGSLSAGEATRVALAAAWLVHPRVLVLDEPIADLDPDSAAVLLDSLRSLLAAGCAVLVAEHRPEPLAVLAREVPIQWFELRAGRLVRVPGRRTDQLASWSDVSLHTAAESSHPRTGAPGSTEVMRDRVIERFGQTVLYVPELTVAPGSVTVLTGPNGSGKTSLLEEIALPAAARVRAPGVALVPHRVDDLLIRDTVADECRYADRRAGAAPGSTARRFESLLAGSLPETMRGELPSRHPRDLSAGTRLALGIAIQLAHDPSLLLLDEPTRGLDAFARQRLAALIAAVVSGGTAVLLATHDHAFSELLEGAGVSVIRRSIVGGELR